MKEAQTIALGSKVKLINGEQLEARLDRPISNLLLSPCVDMVGIVTKVIDVSDFGTGVRDFIVRVEYSDGAVIWEDSTLFEVVGSVL